MKPILAAVCCAVWLTSAAVPASAANRYNPRLHFRSIRTTHFTIHYHQGEEAQARRLARMAEEIRTELQTRLRLQAPSHAHVVLVDQADSANGWSTPLPYNLVEITLTAPSPGSFLGHHDDWLRLVFTHEYTHTMHLDQVGGLMQGFRWALGRHPLSFPNLFVPTWQVEGISTFTESARGLGRVHAADVKAVMGAQAAAGRVPHLDQLGGGWVGWPSGAASYFYGGAFHDYLARLGGEASLGALTRETSSRIPYFGSGAFTAVYGKSVPVLWKLFAAELTAGAEKTAPRSSAAVRLTRSGYMSSGPRFGPVGQTTAPGVPNVFYSSATAHGFPSLRRVGTDGRADQRVTTRYLGNTLAFWQGWAVYDQHEFDGQVALLSDLWATDPRTGRTVRLTRGTRLGDPDISRDGSHLAAVLNRAGQRSLVVFPVSRTAGGHPQIAETASVTLSLPDCSIATPRWSPDGQFIAAVVQCTGGLPDILLYGVQRGTWSLVAPDVRARDLSPAWTPDGRWLLFASDRAGAAHQIYAVLAGAPDTTPVVVVEAPGGATSPDVSPDGKSIVFLSATADGVEVFLGPFPKLTPETRTAGVPAPTAPAPPLPPVPVPATVTTPGTDGGVASADKGYSPWSTLLPRFWQPLVVVDGDLVDVGAAVAGADALGRHTYQVTTTWPVSRPDTSEGQPSSTRPDWSASYAYDRWWPTLFVDASDQTDTVSVRLSGSAGTVTVDSRTREVFAGLLVPIRRVRANQMFLFGASLVDQRTPLAHATLTRGRHALRTGWVFSTAREYGYSISREHGVRASVTAEQVMPSLGADGRSTAITGDVRAYLPGGFRHAVLAVRAAAGSSQGDLSVRRVFTNGGQSVALSGLSFDRHALGLLRGFDEDAFAGTAIVSGSADYRFPLLNVERGTATYPLFINQLHAALFCDAGTVGETLGSLERARWSAGGELSATVTVGYGLSLPLTAGAAWTHDTSRETRPGRATVFVRTGYAF